MSLAPPLKPEQYVSQHHRDRFAALQFDPQHAARIGLDARARAHYAYQPGRIQGGLGVEAHRNPGALTLDRGNPQPLAQGFEDSIVQKVFHRRRESAEAVLQLLAYVLLFLLGADGRDALVGSQAEVLARD